MKKTLVIAALMLSGTAIAQTAQPSTGMTNQPAAGSMTPSGQTVPDPSMSTGPRGVTQQGTDPNGQATAPTGYNQPMMSNTQSMGQSGMSQTTGYSGRGGPAGEYPACSRTVTDSCIQTYERGVRRPRG